MQAPVITGRNELDSANTRLFHHHGSPGLRRTYRAPPR